MENILRKIHWAGGSKRWIYVAATVEAKRLRVEYVWCDATADLD